jgi:hypothetical protein
VAMSAAALRWTWQRPAALENLLRLTHLAGTSSSRPRSAPAGLWRQQEAWKGQNNALDEQVANFLSGLGQAPQFSTAEQQQRPATKPHLYLVLDDREIELDSTTTRRWNSATTRWTSTTTTWALAAAAP